MEETCRMRRPFRKEGATGACAGSALHQFHASVLRTSRLVVITRDRRRHAHADGCESVARQVVLLHEGFDHGLRATLRQRTVVVECADIVGVTDDQHLELRLGCQQFRDFAELYGDRKSVV